MSTELTERANGHDSNERGDSLYLWGGAALVVFGAGLIVATPAVRKSLGVGVGILVAAAIPDLARYMKLRAM